MTQNMIYAWECSICSWGECVFCCHWVIFYRSWLGCVGWQCSFLVTCLIILDDLPNYAVESGVLKSTSIIELSILSIKFLKYLIVVKNKSYQFKNRFTMLRCLELLYVCVLVINPTSINPANSVITTVFCTLMSFKIREIFLEKCSYLCYPHSYLFWCFSFLWLK